MSTEHDARPAARLTLLAGPSGAGKESVVELVRARSPVLWRSVPVTTRSRRAHEVDGTRHRFVTRAEFEAMVAAGELLEWAAYGEYHHGTPAGPIRLRLAAGRPVLATLDLAGARRVRAALPGARLVLLVPPGYRHDAADPDGATDPDGASEIDRTVVNDVVERAADELVSWLGSSFLTPARPQTSG